MGTLDNACLNPPPFLRRNQQGNDIDLPGAAGAEWIAVNVIGNSVLANTSFGSSPAPAPLLRAKRLPRRQQRSPVRRGRQARGRHLVVGVSIPKRRLI